MSTHLCITVRWINESFHGFVNGTESQEWPPSPFRLFQALLAGAHRFGINESLNAALEWLEGQAEPPEILAIAQPSCSNVFNHFVPDNDNRLVHRRSGVRKFACVLLEEFPLVQYLWKLDADDAPPIDALDELTSTLSSLGWAVDQAYASVQIVDPNALDASGLARFRPRPTTTSAIETSRIPKTGSLDDLLQIHSHNSHELANQRERRRKKWPKVFDRVLYTSTERPIGRPCAVFKLLDANEDTCRYPHAKLIHVAGMVRHVAIERMKADLPLWIENSTRWLETFVCGHRGNEEQHQQLSFVPLPSIGHEHADALIRNVLLIAPLGRERELEYVSERLNGEELKPDDEIRSIGIEKPSPNQQAVFLNRLTPPPGKFIANCYLGTSNIWQTVTPVILDGHNKKSKSDKPAAIARQTEKLIRKALMRASTETPCEFTWQSLPFLKNCLSAHKYDRNGRHTGYHRPMHLKSLTAVHVRLTFTHPVPGPITIGAGRHCGFGLFAIDSSI